jgi:hypothetical protein
MSFGFQPNRSRRDRTQTDSVTAQPTTVITRLVRVIHSALWWGRWIARTSRAMTKKKDFCP